jgi:hypothetical protein
MDRRSRRAAWRVSSPRECVCPRLHIKCLYTYIYVTAADDDDDHQELLAAGELISAFSCVCVSLHRIKEHTYKTNRTNKRGLLSHFSSATQPSLGTSFSFLSKCTTSEILLTQFWVVLFCFHRSWPIYPPLAALSFLPDWWRYSSVSFNETLIVMLVSSVFFLALVNQIYLTFFYFSLKQ